MSALNILPPPKTMSSRGPVAAHGLSAKASKGAPVWPDTGTIPVGKRCFDVTLACLLAPPVACLCLVIAITLLLAQGRPVFYRSERMRTPTKGFVLWKFRTMSGEGLPPTVTAGHLAARVTPIGRVLRATRLDELPQLWNVLRGDMSLVGPRPPLRSVVERNLAIYAQVLAVPPGVTGLATVVFHRTEARCLSACSSAEDADRLYDRLCVLRKARIDSLYARRRWRPGLDLAILWATIVGSMPGRRSMYRRG